MMMSVGLESAQYPCTIQARVMAMLSKRCNPKGDIKLTITFGDGRGCQSVQQSGTQLGRDVNKRLLRKSYINN